MGSPMDCYTFGRQLVETGDLDPVYVLLHEAQLDPVEQAHWLMAYWGFYHVGTASWIADGVECPWFYDRFAIAAGSKDYPRCHERRHFRGAFAMKTAAWLREQTVGDLFAEFDRAAYERRVLTAAEVMDYVKEWYSFGDWISFKVADMLERLGIVRVEFDLATAFYDGSPTKGAKLLWDREGQPHAGFGDAVTGWAAGRILSELKGLTAPPRHERPLNVQEAETICCKWSSYINNHYHVGEDIEACRRGLAWASTKRCKTAQRLYSAGRKGGLW